MYTLRSLISQPEPLDITVFEAQAEMGQGMPYHPKWNDASMLANIASIEIPPVCETLLDWLARQNDERLCRLGIARHELNARAFYPRITLGQYFQDQLRQLVACAPSLGHRVTLLPQHRVYDIAMQPDGSAILIAGHARARFIATHVVMATGHNLPPHPETRPGYFLSPWPASALRTIRNCPVGIRGTSLSAIDAAVALALAHGTFRPNAQAGLDYLPEPGSGNFHLTLMSRKGILPEADFYHPIPYEPLTLCTHAAISRLIESGREHMLDAVFVLFKAELAACDPEYAQRMNLGHFTLEQFSDAYFADRSRTNPFAWAEHNLAEAQANYCNAHTIAWRYAILRMHEVIARAVRYFSATDHKRFSRYLKPVFIDDYATVPHLSIQRLLALHRAGKLDILRLGKNYHIDALEPAPGAILRRGKDIWHFPAFIEATGQRGLSAQDMPFPSLWGIVHNATAPDDEDIGGIALDEFFRPISEEADCSRLYCLSVPFLLAQFPFAQGITSSHDMGKTVAAHIAGNLANPYMHMEQSHETIRDLYRW